MGEWTKEKIEWFRARMKDWPNSNINTNEEFDSALSEIECLHAENERLKTCLDSKNIVINSKNEQINTLVWTIEEMGSNIANKKYFMPLSVKHLIEAERERQIEKWGEQNHDDYHWLAILVEEVGELAEAILHNEFGGHAAGTEETELVHSVAVGVQWLEAKEKNQKK